MKLRRGIVAVATSLALATGTAVVAPAAQAQSAAADAGSSAGIGIVSSLIGLGISVAFWGTVYNFLVNHGHVNGQIIRELPVF
ncbi:hypothetical protein [Corynebacterium epidermidicanis]|uniref:Secreted protein n=1 Tax=Corynebacterium epidermidicanis TaxID=1050174 RepID=A0A0G3GTY1_9CORY|nr:hypothetical protein [Corynebacterium epidermidicanis]AKK04000.1 hypothetical protein CEPID_10855 [Corynebacterium epidermidicanis]